MKLSSEALRALSMCLFTSTRFRRHVRLTFKLYRPGKGQYEIVQGGDEGSFKLDFELDDLGVFYRELKVRIEEALSRFKYLDGLELAFANNVFLASSKEGLEKRASEQFEWSDSSRNPEGEFDMGRLVVCDFKTNDMDAIRNEFHASRFAEVFDAEFFIVLKTKNSFHLWTSVLDYSDNKFFGNLLLVFGDLVDVKWTGLALTRGCGYIRLTENAKGPITFGFDNLDYRLPVNAGVGDKTLLVREIIHRNTGIEP